MLVRRVLSVVLVAAALAVLVPGAHAQSQSGFVSASSTCQEGVFEFQLFVGVARGAQAVLPLEVTAEDSQGTPLGEQFFNFGDGFYQGSITYSQAPSGDVTFKLWFVPKDTVKETRPQQAVSIGKLIDQITVPAQCDAGCTALVPLPTWAVMGKFVADAPLSWTPGQLIAPAMAVKSGQTYYVTGQDASGTYRQILLECEFVWVPFNSVGPDPEPLWNNKPLPTNVVQ